MCILTGSCMTASASAATTWEVQSAPGNQSQSRPHYPSTTVQREVDLDPTVTRLHSKGIHLIV